MIGFLEKFFPTDKKWEEIIEVDTPLLDLDSPDHVQEMIQRVLEIKKEDPNAFNHLKDRKKKSFE